MDFFNKYGTVLAVWRRYFPGGGSSNNNNNNNQRAIATTSSETTDDANTTTTTTNNNNNNVNRTKPSVFVVFETAEQAHNFVATPP